MKDYKKQIVVDFEDYPELFGALIQFAKDEITSPEYAIKKLIYLACEYGFDFGNEPESKFPFMKYGINFSKDSKD